LIIAVSSYLPLSSIWTLMMHSLSMHHHNFDTDFNSPLTLRFPGCYQI